MGFYVGSVFGFGVLEGVGGLRWGNKGLVARFDFGFGVAKTTRNVMWGSILTPPRKKC